MRLGEEFQDRDDVATLIKAVGLERLKDTEEVLARYYPLGRYPVKSRYVLEDLLGGQWRSGRAVNCPPSLLS